MNRSSCDKTAPSGTSSIFHTCLWWLKRWTEELCLGRVCSALPEEKEKGAWRSESAAVASDIGVGDKELSQQVLENNFYWYWRSLSTTSPLAVELQKFARKNCLDRLRARDLTSSQVFSCKPRPYDAERAREPTIP